MEAPTLFVRDGDTFVGTTLTRGPWNPAHANGSSALALLAHCLDDVPTLVPMLLARFTVDLMRPLPVGRPLRVDSRVRREGKKLQIVEMVLLDGDVECVLVTALRLRDQPVGDGQLVPTGSTDGPPPRHFAPPDGSLNLRDLRPEPSGALLASDICKAPRTDAAGAATWVRMLVPVVAGEPVRTNARMAYAFDFASLVGLEVDITTVSMINPDVSAHVLRPAVGEWISLVGDTRVHAPVGRSMSYAEARDMLGVFAYVSASQIVEPLPT